jgi:hypothetical protein
LLAFTSVYFSGSRFFNGLRAIQIKNFSLCLQLLGHGRDAFHPLSSTPTSRLSNPANRKSITRCSVLYKQMSVALISGFSDLPLPARRLDASSKGASGPPLGQGHDSALRKPRAPTNSTALCRCQTRRMALSIPSRPFKADEPIGLSLAFQGLRSSAQTARGRAQPIARTRRPGLQASQGPASTGGCPATGRSGEP